MNLFIFKAMSKILKIQIMMKISMRRKIVLTVMMILRNLCLEVKMTLKETLMNSL